MVADLRRGINLAGVFDRRDDRPGWPVRSEHLAAIADAGFTAVRLPVRWWGRADKLLAPVRELVDAARSQRLAVVVTMHHADAVNRDPVGSAAPLTALWRRIAGSFAGAGGQLAFELLNEPRPPMTAAHWNALLPTVLTGVREVDPGRLVIASGAQASTLSGLRQLELPRDDHLIATVHYYEPFRFTQPRRGMGARIGALARHGMGHAGRPRRGHHRPGSGRRLGAPAQRAALRRRVRHARHRRPGLAPPLDALGPARARPPPRPVVLLGLRDRLRGL